MNKKRIGELNGTPIVIGKKNYANKSEYYMTLNKDNTYQKLEQRVYGDKFKSILGGGSDDDSDSDIYLGSFDINDLPVLDGFNDYGKVAYVNDTNKMAYWDGYGWTYVGGSVVTPRYLKFTAVSSEPVIGFLVYNDNYQLPKEYEVPNIEYSTDNGVTWTSYDVYVGKDMSQAFAINLNEGESVLFRGENDTLTYYIEAEDDYVFLRVNVVGGEIAASGDVTALLNGVGGDVALANACYYGMFYGCTRLASAPALPSTTLAADCYRNMFYECDYLTEAPILPAIKLANSCYKLMFLGCTSLVQAPALPATTLAKGCYDSMFRGCTDLTTAPALPATTLAEGCYYDMFQDCTGLVESPVLSATTLAKDCYYGMFKGCTSIISYDVATLNDSDDVFQVNTSCTSFTIHAETPPIISETTISGLKEDCTIYVPEASVDAYMTAEYWNERRKHIRAEHN